MIDLDKIKLGDTVFEVVKLNGNRRIIEHPLIQSDFEFLYKIFATREEAEDYIHNENT